MASDLLTAELAVKQFIDLCNNIGSSCTVRRSISHKTAVKFLYARKFDVSRAVSLYRQHEEIRLTECLYNIDADVEPLRSELQTGKFTILPARDSSGAAIALFTASKHSPLRVTHTTTLQGIVYQLDCALQNTDTQKAGLLFIYDMSGSKYSNFDYDLSQKILTLLKGGYPARLKKVLIVTAPLWFKAPFKILRLFVREKLRERVFTVSVPTLSLHVPRKALPTHLGGSLPIDHAAWLLYCRKSMTNCEDDLLANNGQPSLKNSSSTVPIGSHIVGSTSTATNVTIAPIGVNRECTLAVVEDIDSVESNNKQITIINGNLTKSITDVTSTTSPFSTNNKSSTIDTIIIPTTVTGATPTNTTASTPTFINKANTDINSSTGSAAINSVLLLNGDRSTLFHDLWSENPPSSASSGFSDDDSLAGTEGDAKTIEQIVEMLKERGKNGLVKEYGEIRNRAPEGTFVQARMRNNLSKNRYTDVLCYDHSRVILSQESGDESSDYINANFVDGYKQKHAYISTQGPLQKTSLDFWRMIWEQYCLVIVMTTRVMERGRVKCGQYWEPSVNGSSEFGHFRVRTVSIETNENYIITSLQLRNLKTEETRNASHWQFTSWPDYGVPSSAISMLNFLQKVRDKQSEMVKAVGDAWAGHPRGPPIVVHCSAGIGRTGTFITLDICISRLEDAGTVDIRSTVEKIRSQRAFSIQMPDQYVFCHLALLEYAISRGQLKAVDLSEFDKDDESD